MAPKQLSRSGKGKRVKANAPTVTKRVGYDGASDVRKGICCYDGCKKRLPQPSDDNLKPIACNEHEETYEVGYSYMTEDGCRAKYNSELEFAETFDSSHVIVNKAEEKSCNDGSVEKGTEHFQEVGRTYGAYDLKEPLERLPRLM